MIGININIKARIVCQKLKIPFIDFLILKMTNKITNISV